MFLCLQSEFPPVLSKTLPSFGSFQRVPLTPPGNNVLVVRLVPIGVNERTVDSGEVLNENQVLSTEWVTVPGKDLRRV